MEGEDRAVPASEPAPIRAGLGSLAALRRHPPPRPTLTAPPAGTRHGEPRGGGADAASRPRYRRVARHLPPRPWHAAPPEPCGSVKVYKRAILHRRKTPRRARVRSSTPLHFHGGPPAPSHTGPGNLDWPAPPLRRG